MADNGEIVLPASIRERLNIGAGDEVSIQTNHDKIIIEKVVKPLNYQPSDVERDDENDLM
ncbi:AbrB/MazE/SpoVT family DNA-binding domain-containing protein [Nicoliella lavandulae]|uniref:AbrB/MazE/SpoVT family DNA-binding domain-containing protein n=1 Tax=Nicoliella lavandulae TaxID=3082954 RepID=A0ABU8SJ52_9LACO